MDFTATVSVVVIINVFMQTSSSYSDNDILRFDLPAEPTIDPDSVCKSIASLTLPQLALCQKYPHATASAVQGVQLAVHECKRQFSGQRWNCSDLDGTTAQNHPILSRGFRETAFAHALTAAGIVHQVATACASGKIASCGCDNSVSGSVTQDGGWEWGGCSHDLGFGTKFSRRFLQGKGNDLQSLIQAHNSKLGRKAVVDQKSTKCKCHGMSSSCELKTCWLAAPDFHKVGQRLQTLYKTAIQVDRTNSVEGRLIPATSYVPENGGEMKRQYLGKNLVFYERSPTFCEADSHLGIVGTAGRLCNTSSHGVDGCRTLCCGRGYFTVKVKRTEKCNCKFHWCCYVVCEKCIFNDWVTVCK